MQAYSKIAVTVGALAIAACSNEASVPDVQDVPSASDNPASPPPPPPTSDAGPQLDPLQPLDLSDMSLWNWDGRWHASNWDHEFSDVPWVFDRVGAYGDDVIFDLDTGGAPELKGQNQQYERRGLWEVDVSLPYGQEGLVAAPLWLYNQDSRDEIDIEVTRHGIELTLHAYHTGKHRTAHHIVADTAKISAERMRLGIDLDIDQGFVEFYIDGRTVHRFTKADHPDAFPTNSLKPIISMWTAKKDLGWAEGWLGKWNGESAEMVIHGYGYTPEGAKG